MTRHEGTLADWDDGRGFGFVSTAGSRDRVFVHVKAFGDRRRPRNGDRISFVVARDESGRPRATEVRYAGLAHRGRSDLTTAGLVAAAFFVALAGAVALERLPVLVLAIDSVLSGLAFLLYRSDKRAAERGTWRTPEATLLSVGLLGGWPGALVARALFRHKTRKQPFVALYWITVVVHCAVLAWAATTDLSR